MTYKYLGSDFLSHSTLPLNMDSSLDDKLEAVSDFVKTHIVPYQEILDDAAAPDMPSWMRQRILELIIINFEPVLQLLTFALRVSSIQSIKPYLPQITEYLTSLTSDRKNGVNLSFTTQQMKLW